ncbi:MAG: adenylyl cyclase, partial [Gammaproteobacteria bacterium]|nr:adenylyl cyclase [Gammaproteobacteria bacterium]
MSLIAELKRRNVFRVAVAYAVIAWVLAQVADLAFDNFGAPDWVPKSVLFILALGFPLAIFFAWAFEMTPEGVKKEKDVERSQSITSQTGRKLDFLIIGVLLIAVGLLLVDKFVLREVASPGSAEMVAAENTDKSLAVLPFVAMSNGPDDEYFADGLTEEILNSLAQLPELLVTARTSAFSFKGLDVPVPEIAAKLGVAHVVEGSVRRAGDQLRITAQLIRAHDGFHLWSDTYDRSSADSFGVQGEIAEKVAAALDIVLDEQQLAKMHSSGMRNPEAFIAYQKGQEIYRRAHGTDDDNEEVAELRAANDYFE